MNGGRRRGIAEELNASVTCFMESGANADSVSILLREIHPDLHDNISRTPYGAALSPRKASGCVGDRERTLAFLRGLNAAVQEVLSRKPKVHILEAGGGPNPLSVLLPAAQDSRVKVTSIDIHGQSIVASSNLADTLGVNFTGIEADLVSGNWACEDPDIIVVETMNAGLLDEPQGAITWILAKRFGQTPIFLPEKITVHALLNRSRAWGMYYPSHSYALGELACIDAAFRSAAQTASLHTALNIRRGFEVPDGWDAAALCVQTTVDVYGDFAIPPNHSTVTRTLEYITQSPNGASNIDVVGQMGGRAFSIERPLT